MPPKSKEPAKVPAVELTPDAPQGIPLTIGGPDELDVTDPPALSPEMQALQDSNEDLKKRLDDAAARETAQMSRLDQLLAAPAATPNVPLQVAPAVPLADLPDQTLNPIEFNKALNDRITTAAQAAAVPIQTASTQQQKIGELRSTFQARHPKLMEFSDLVEGEMKRRAVEAASAGRDPEAMMFTDVPKFVDEVAKAVETRLEGIRGPEAPKVEKPARDVELLGGGPVTPDPGKKIEKKPMGMIEQLKKAQRDSGMM